MLLTPRAGCEWVFAFTGESRAQRFPFHGKREIFSQGCDSHNIN